MITMLGPGNLVGPGTQMGQRIFNWGGSSNGYSPVVVGILVTLGVCVLTLGVLFICGAFKKEMK